MQQDVESHLTSVSKPTYWCYHHLILCSTMCFIRPKDLQWDFICSFYNFFGCFFVTASCFGDLLDVPADESALNQEKTKWNDAMTYLACSWQNTRINKTLPRVYLWFCLTRQCNSEGLFCFSCCNWKKK